MVIDDRVGLAASELSVLEGELSPIGSLSRLIVWGLAQQPESVVVDVIVQDEFTHDVIMSWTGSRHLVFDST